MVTTILQCCLCLSIVLLVRIFLSFGTFLLHRICFSLRVFLSVRIFLSFGIFLSQRNFFSVRIFHVLRVFHDPEDVQRLCHPTVAVARPFVGSSWRQNSGGSVSSFIQNNAQLRFRPRMMTSTVYTLTESVSTRARVTLVLLVPLIL